MVTHTFVATHVGMSCRTFAQLTERTDAQLKNFGEFVVIVLTFIGISLASVLVGVLLGLAASAVRAVSVTCCHYELRPFKITIMLAIASLKRR